MKIKKGFEMRSVAGENVVVATGVENIDFSKMISMNSSAAYLWEECEKMESFTAESMAQMLLEKYDVSSELAESDARRVAEQWLDVGIVEA